MGKFDQPRIISPLIKIDKKKKINPIYYQDQEINGKNRFAILRTTDNGAYVRGDMLYYKIDGVEVYTEINNIIFVDLNNKSVTIKQYDKVADNIAPENPEERQYIILMYLNDYDENSQCVWESMIGRLTAYEFIKQYIDIYKFNPDKSVVITDNVAFKNALTVTQFIKYLQNGNLVEEDNFNIDQYKVDEED